MAITALTTVSTRVEVLERSDVTYAEKVRACAKVINEVYCEFYKMESLRLSDLEQTADIEKTNVTYLVAIDTESGKYIGGARLFCDKDGNLVPLENERILGPVAVEKKYTGQGVGTALIKEAITYAFTTSVVQKVYIVAKEKDELEKPFYTRHFGFKNTGEMADDEYHTFVLLRSPILL